MQCKYCGKDIPIIKICPYCNRELDVRQMQAIERDLMQKFEKMINRGYKYQDQYLNDVDPTDEFIMSKRKGRPSPFHPF